LVSITEVISFPVAPLVGPMLICNWAVRHRLPEPPAEFDGGDVDAADDGDEAACCCEHATVSAAIATISAVLCQLN